MYQYQQLCINYSACIANYRYTEILTYRQKLPRLKLTKLRWVLQFSLFLVCDLRLTYKLDHELDNTKAQLALQLQLYM